MTEREQALANPMAASPSKKGTSLLSIIVRTREIPLIVIIVLIVAIMSFQSPFFFSAANFRTIAIGFAPTAIISVGMAILLVSGGFDLSVGSVVALSGTIVALLIDIGLPIPVSVLLVLLLGTLIGLANGVMVTYIKINPLVATLGTLSVARGLALVLTQGRSVQLPSEFGFVGNEQLLGIPYMVVIMLIIVIVGDLALRHTRFLRQVYYIGSNEKSALLSGIPVNHMRLITYTLTALLSSLAGILLSSRLQAGTPTAASGLELQVLAAAVIGGASLTGGEGTVLGAFLGVVFVGLISNVMTFLAVSVYYQQVVTGVILIVAVAIDMLVRRFTK